MRHAYVQFTSDSYGSGLRKCFSKTLSKQTTLLSDEIYTGHKNCACLPTCVLQIECANLIPHLPFEINVLFKLSFPSKKGPRRISSLVKVSRVPPTVSLHRRPISKRIFSRFTGAVISQTSKTPSHYHRYRRRYDRRYYDSPWPSVSSESGRWVRINAGRDRESFVPLAGSFENKIFLRLVVIFIVIGFKTWSRASLYLYICRNLHASPPLCR